MSQPLKVAWSLPMRRDGTKGVLHAFLGIFSGPVCGRRRVSAGLPGTGLERRCSHCERMVSEGRQVPFTGAHTRKRWEAASAK